MISQDYRQQDDDARRRISSSIGDTLFVEAGAGTGKTRALVDRIIAIILGGVPVDRIAAITFTERAAAELRDRVRSGLEAHAREHGPSEAIGEALASLDRAQLSTIHSFCQTLLKSFASQSGIDPDFKVLDAVADARRTQQKWREEIEHLADDADAPRAIDRALSLGLTPRDLEAVAMTLLKAADLAEEMERHPITLPEPVWPDIPLLIRRLEATGYQYVDAEDKLRKAIELWAQFLERLQTAGDWREALLPAMPWLGSGPGVKTNWGHSGAMSKADALESATLIRDEFEALKTHSRNKALADVLPFIVRFVRKDEVRRGREGAMTFADLIHRVRDILNNSASARESLRGRYDVLLIDEFQDTDPLQVDIAVAFGTDPATGQIEPGRLFLVGDPKQSIYRFRGADMAIYSRTQETVRAANGAFESLALNKRSRPPIIDWVNAVFGQVIGGGDDPSVQPPYRDIHPDRDTGLTGPGVGYVGGQIEALAAVVRNFDAAAIAELCCLAVGKPWEVEERDGTVRPARYSDIAVLIPTRTGLSALERALSARDVHYRVESGSLIYRTQEVRDLLNSLAAINDPNDEVAIVGALRSPAFACSDTELAEFRSQGGRFDYLSRGNAEIPGRVSASLSLLAAYHEKRHASSLAALIERFAAERGLVETGILFAGDRNSFRRVRYLAGQARAFEEGVPESLQSLVSWLEDQAGQQMLDNEGSGLDDDEDAIHIQTIHGSKGLEFPIVLAGGLTAAPDPRRAGPRLLRDRETGEYAISVGAKTSGRLFVVGDYDRLSDLEESHAHAEFRRLLYVASTRARDHLVVSLYHGARQTDSAAQVLIRADAMGLATEVHLPQTRADGRHPLAGLEVEIPPGLNGPRLAELRSSLVANAAVRRYTSATSLKGAALTQEADSPDKEPAREDETEPWSRGRAATRVGRAVHATLQSLPLAADDAEIASFSRAQAVAEAVPHLAGRIESLVRWIVKESSAWKRARSAPRALREVPFALETDGDVVEGFIDMVLEGEHGLEIIDWKTDQVSAAEVPERLRNYTLQAGLYVHGLREATRLSVASVTYVFASAKVEDSPGSPDDLAQVALEVLAAASP